MRGRINRILNTTSYLSDFAMPTLIYRSNTIIKYYSSSNTELDNEAPHSLEIVALQITRTVIRFSCVT